MVVTSGVTLTWREWPDERDWRERRDWREKHEAGEERNGRQTHDA